MQRTSCWERLKAGGKGDDRAFTDFKQPDPVLEEGTPGEPNKHQRCEKKSNVSNPA